MCTNQFHFLSHDVSFLCEVRHIVYCVGFVHIRNFLMSFCSCFEVLRATFTTSEPEFHVRDLSNEALVGRDSDAASPTPHTVQPFVRKLFVICGTVLSKCTVSKQASFLSYGLAVICPPLFASCSPFCFACLQMPTVTTASLSS